MAKRFIDTDIFRKDFIRGMEAPYKLLWLYIINECNHAGIWEVELEIAEIRLGVKFKTPPQNIFGNKINICHGGTKWFIPSFIEFQYGELNPANRAHQSVIQILKKYNLLDESFKPLISPLQGAMDMDMDKDKDMDKEKPRAKNELDWSKCPDDFKPVFAVWVDYKKSKGKKYVQAGLNALFSQKIAEYKTPELLHDAIQHSMASGYDGIYPKNNTKKEEPKTRWNRLTQ